MDKGSISTFRSKLDDTLGCHDLTDHEAVNNLIKSQILQSSSSDFGGNLEDVVETRAKEVSTLLEMLRSASSTNLSSNMLDRNWNIKQDTEEFRVMYREGPIGTPFHELLVEGFVDGPLDVLLCVSWEAILYKEWWPDISFPPFKVLSSDCVKRVRIGEQVSLVRMKLPWPLSAREALVHYFALEYFENDLMVVLLNSLPDSNNGNRSGYGFTWEGIPDPKNAIRIGVAGGLALLKLDANRTYFRTVARVDPKLDWLPPSLINFISRQIVGSGFKLFKKEVESISKGNDKFSKYIKDPLYERIRKALYATDDESKKLAESESGDPEFRQLTEIDEDDEEENQNLNLESPSDSNKSVEKKTPSSISPQVTQALETLDNVISMLQEHRFDIEKWKTNTNKEETSHSEVSANQNSSDPSSTGANLLMEQGIDESSLSNVRSSSLAAKCHQNGVGKTSAKGKWVKSAMAVAFLPSCFRREVAS